MQLNAVTELGGGGSFNSASSTVSFWI